MAGGTFTVRVVFSSIHFQNSVIVQTAALDPDKSAQTPARPPPPVYFRLCGSDHPGTPSKWDQAGFVPGLASFPRWNVLEVCPVLAGVSISFLCKAE